METKRILIACGSGIATSTMLCSKISLWLEDEGIPCEITQCNIIEIEGYESRNDIIVSSAKLEKEYSIPTVMGLGFISGIGVDEIKAEILEKLGVNK